MDVTDLIAVDDEANRTVVQAVARAFDLAEHLALSPRPMALRDLAAATRLPTSTIHRLINTLVRLGYAQQEPDHRYSLGPLFISLGEAATRRLAAFAAPHLERLAERTGETVNLSVVQRDRLVYLAQAHGRHPVRTFTQVGGQFLPHATAAGKVMLAARPIDEVRALLARTGMVARTRRTVTSPDDLLRELEDVRAHGFSVDDGEQEEGVRCVAVLIARPTEAALSISGPEVRLDDERIRSLAMELRRTAHDLVESISSSLDCGL
jgi:IclR family acetate operon transcriptional repressor